MSIEGNNYNLQANIEYKKPIYTKNPVKRDPIIEKIKIKKPIILPTSYKDTKVIRDKNEYESTGYNNTYLPSVVNPSNNNEYYTNTNQTYNNDYNIISNNNDYNVITYGQTETIIDNGNYNNVDYDTKTLEINNYEDNTYNITPSSKDISSNNVINDQILANTNNYTYNSISEDTTATIGAETTYDNNILYNTQNTVITNDNNYNYENPVITNDNANDLNTNYYNQNYNVYTYNTYNTYNKYSPYSITTFEHDKNKYHNISVEIESDSSNINKYLYYDNQYNNTINYENPGGLKNIKIKKLSHNNRRKYSPKKIPIDENNNKNNLKEYFHKVKITKKKKSHHHKHENNNNSIRKKKSKIKIFSYSQKNLDDKLDNPNQSDKKNNENKNVNQKEINFEDISEIKHKNEIEVSNSSEQNGNIKKIITEKNEEDLNKNKGNKDDIKKENNKELENKSIKSSKKEKNNNLDELDNNLDYHDKFIEKMENIDF